MIIIKTKVEYLRSQDSNKSEYIIYPYTLLSAITNESGDSLEDTLKKFLISEFDSVFATTDHVHIINLLEMDEAFELTFTYLDIDNLPDINEVGIYGCSVMYNDQIHIIKGNKHFKYNAYEYWELESTLPFECSNAMAINYNGEIHLFNNTDHYKYVNRLWEKMSTLPVNIKGGSVVNVKDTIHLLKGLSHYKFIDGVWERISTLPFEFKYYN